MNAGDAWMPRLTEAAPTVAYIDGPYLRMLAIALGARMTTEGLILMAEALRAWAGEARLDGWGDLAAEREALARLVDREARWRSPTLSLPRPA